MKMGSAEAAVLRLDTGPGADSATKESPSESLSFWPADQFLLRLSSDPVIGRPILLPLFYREA